jgi:hypothetical protein
MGARGCALFCLVFAISKISFGQQVALPNNQQFQAYLSNEKQIEDEKIQVFQQILNHQMQQMQSYGVPTQKLKQWDGRFNIKSSSQGRDPTGTMTFQMQPLLAH